MDHAHIYTHTQTYTPPQAVLIVDSGLEPVDGEGYNAGKDGGSAVDQRNHDGLALKVVVVLVVAGERYERSKAQTQREEDLSGCVDPCVRVGELIHLEKDNRTCGSVCVGHVCCVEALVQTYIRGEHVGYSNEGAFEGKASNQVDKEDDVGERCCEGHCLQTKRTNLHHVR